MFRDSIIIILLDKMTVVVAWLSAEDYFQWSTVIIFKYNNEKQVHDKILKRIYYNKSLSRGSGAEINLGIDFIDAHVHTVRVTGP